MAIASMQLDPNAQAYTDLADLDPTAATKLAGIAEGAEVNPADLAELDSTAASKLSGIEAGATADQTGAEVQTAILGLDDADRLLVKTNPVAGEFKVSAIQRDADGKLDIEYDDVAEE